MTRTKRHRLATATREEVSREGSLDQFRGQGSSRGAFHRAAQLGIIAVGASERASYNGSIEASQASDVGSIPIARSIRLIHLDDFTRVAPISTDLSSMESALPPKRIQNLPS